MEPTEIQLVPTPEEEAPPANGDAPIAEAASEELTRQLFIVPDATAGETADAKLKAVLEAVIYVTEEPLTVAQMATALVQPPEVVKQLLKELLFDCAREDRGITIREVAGGFKMATKPEHHEAVRAFVKNLKPPLKLSLPALETLAVIAYKQPITAPEIMEIRGVQGTGVLKTLLDRKLIGTGGRKQVVGKPILYKTTRDFLIQFGLKDLTELPTLKEFEELGRLALSEGELPPPDSDPDPGQFPVEDPPADVPPDTPPVHEPGPDPEPVHEPEPGPDGPGDPQQNPVTNES